MAKYCSDCEYINTSDKKKEGIYKCRVRKCYICSCDNSCDKFRETYAKTGYEKQKLYDLGKNVDEDTTPLTLYVIVLIVLSILVFFGKMMGY